MLNDEFFFKIIKKNKKYGSTLVNPLTLQPLAYDWNKPIEMKVKENKYKDQLSEKLNIEG